MGYVSTERFLAFDFTNIQLLIVAYIVGFRWKLDENDRNTFGRVVVNGSSTAPQTFRGATYNRSIDISILVVTCSKKVAIIGQTLE